MRKRLWCAAWAAAIGPWCAAYADTSDVTWQTRVTVAKQGAHCGDDPNCFNRYHPAIARAGLYPVSVAVDLVVGQVVGVPNYTVSAIIDLEVFEE